jgi:predicted Rossmann-fold nucleotide-binding protein
MEAVSAGAHEEGGHVIGVTLQTFRGRKAPNRFVREEREAEDLFARVRLLAHSDAWVAVAGGVGTLAEVALGWNLLQHDPSEARPLILVGPRWRAIVPELLRTLVVDDADGGLLRCVDDVGAAVEEVVAAAGPRPAPEAPER